MPFSVQSHFPERFSTFPVGHTIISEKLLSGSTVSTILPFAALSSYSPNTSDSDLTIEHPVTKNDAVNMAVNTALGTRDCLMLVFIDPFSVYAATYTDRGQ